MLGPAAAAGPVIQLGAGDVASSAVAAIATCPVRDPIAAWPAGAAAAAAAARVCPPGSAGIAVAPRRAGRLQGGATWVRSPISACPAPAREAVANTPAASYRRSGTKRAVPSCRAVADVCTTGGAPGSNRDGDRARQGQAVIFDGASTATATATAVAIVSPCATGAASLDQDPGAGDYS